MLHLAATNCEWLFIWINTLMTQTQSTIELQFPSTLGYERIARETVAALARSLGFPPERVDDVRTAVGEACINAIEHGNQQRAHLRIHVRCIVSSSRLVIIISDQGLRFHSLAQGAGPGIEQKLAGLAAARGMGLMLINQLVDESGFLPSRPGQGNRFRIALYKTPRHSVQDAAFC